MSIYKCVFLHPTTCFHPQDSLGGNSRTAMVATISPAADNYVETLSTLRYADRAKSIVNHAVVNEDPNARIIRELREEVEKLREQLTEAEVRPDPVRMHAVVTSQSHECAETFCCHQSMKAPELKEQLEESEKLIKEMTVSWEEKLRKTEAVAQVRLSPFPKVQLFEWMVYGPFSGLATRPGESLHLVC